MSGGDLIAGVESGSVLRPTSHPNRHATTVVHRAPEVRSFGAEGSGMSAEGVAREESGCGWGATGNRHQNNGRWSWHAAVRRGTQRDSQDTANILSVLHTTCRAVDPATRHANMSRDRRLGDCAIARVSEDYC